MTDFIEIQTLSPKPVKTIGNQLARNHQNERSSIEVIALQISENKKRREEKLRNIKECLQEEAEKIRSKPNTILFIINLIYPVALSGLNAYIFLNSQIKELKIILVNALVYSGLVLSLISSFLIAPWKQVLKLHCIPDSIVPVMIATISSFYSYILYQTDSSWMEKVCLACFPVWVIYFAGYLRVLVAYGDLARWEVISYKLVVMICGLIFFYIGYDYMMGTYKVTNGFLVELETTIKDMIYLYVFGAVEMFFQFYRRLSYFDQTEQLQYCYQFKDSAEQEKKMINQTSYKQLQVNTAFQQLQELRLLYQFSGQNFSEVSSITSHQQ